MTSPAVQHSWRDALVKPMTSIREAVRVLDQSALKIVLVVDEEQRLVGTITDGDIRRALANGQNNVAAADIMTRNPRTIQEDGLAAEALSMLSEFHITALFIVDAQNVPIGLLHVHDCLAIGVV